MPQDDGPSSDWFSSEVPGAKAAALAVLWAPTFWTYGRADRLLNDHPDLSLEVCYRRSHVHPRVGSGWNISSRGVSECASVSYDGSVTGHRSSIGARCYRLVMITRWPRICRITSVWLRRRGSSSASLAGRACAWSPRRGRGLRCLSGAVT